MTTVVNARDELLASLTAMRDRLPADDRATLERAIEYIGALDGQLSNLRWLASQRYRAKTERIAPGQLAMDFIAHLLGKSDSGLPSTDAATPTPATTKQPPRSKRKSNIKTIARETIDRNLPEESRQCACGELQQPSHFTESSFLRYTPATVTLVTERVWHYACPNDCQPHAVALATPKLIDNSLCSSSLLA